MIQKTTYKGSVYLSGPIAGLSYEEARYGWRMTVAAQLEQGIKVLSPMRHEGHLSEIKGPLDPAGQLDHFFSGAQIIVEKDRLDIERCDLMLVNLLGAKKVSIGTVAEIGMATALGKKMILVMEDTGSMIIGESDEGEYGQFPTHNIYGNNIHDHPFVTVPASLRLNNLDDAIYAVNQLLSEGL